MRTLPLHLEAGSDVRASLEQLARELGLQGFVLSVVGNLSHACFQCPGQAGPTLLRGELEIITLSGTLAPQGVHLHLSLSDGDCRVWGGHLEHGSLVLRGADLLVGVLDSTDLSLAGHNPGAAATEPTATQPTAIEPTATEATAIEPAAASALALAPAAAVSQASEASASAEPRLEVAVLAGCPWSARALRLLRTLAIPHRVETLESDEQRLALHQRSGLRTVPVVFLDGVVIGGYDALAELHGSGELEELRGF